MALFVKDDKAQKSDEPLPAVVPASTTPNPPSAGRDVQAHLGQGSRAEGKLSFDGSVRIDGQVEGEINAQETVLLGETADVSAQIVASVIVVEGRVTGDLNARKRVELKAPASVAGNINTPCLVIHEGVVFEGHCSMGGAAAGRAERTDKRVALFPAEGANRRPSEAAG